MLLLFMMCASLLAQDAKENAEFKLAVGLYNDRMYDLAVEQFKNFIAAYPPTSQGLEARFYLGLTQMKLKRYDEARVTFQNFALTYTEHEKAPEAWILVGDAFAASGNQREAASAYERVKTFHLKSILVPDALAKAATLYRHLGDRQQAKNIVRTILQEYPSDKSAQRIRLLLAEMYAEEGNIDLAIREARHVSESSSSTETKATALLTLGKIQAFTSLFNDAIATLTPLAASTKKSTVSSLAAFELGLLDLGADNYTSAIEHFKVVVADTSIDDSLQAQTMYYLGEAYFGQKKFSGSQKAFENVIENFQNNPIVQHAYIEAGVSAAHNNEPEKALAHFQHAITYPSSTVIWRASLEAFRLARTARRYTEAAQFAMTQLISNASQQRRSELLYELGEMYQKDIRDYRKAIDVYDQMRQQFPSSPLADRAGMRSAECYESIGDIRNALAMYRLVAEQYPASDDIEAARKRIDSLTTFQLKNHDDATQKLALTVEGIASQQSKASVAYQLGMIYYQDLKDYAAAARQFTIAIDNGLNAQQFVDAYYYRARSYHFLSLSDASATDQAILYYGAFLKQYPTSVWSDDAAYHLMTMKVNRSTTGERSTLMNEFLASYPDSPHRDDVMIALGTYWFTSGSVREAVVIFSKFSHDHANPPRIADAWYLLGTAYNQLHQIDSAVIFWKKAITASPSTRSTVEALWSLVEIMQKNKQHTEALTYAQRITKEFYYTSYASRCNSILPEFYLNTGNTNDAVAFLTTQLDDDTEEPSLFYLAQAYEQKNDMNKSRSYYHQYLARHRNGSHAADALYALGNVARSKGQTGLASSYFKQAALLETSGSATQDIADLLFQTEQYADAAKQYQQLSRQTDSLDQKKYFASRAIVATLRADKLTDAQTLMTEFEKTYGADKAAQAEFTYERAGYYYRKLDYVTAGKLYKNVSDDFEDTRFGPYGHFYLGKILEVTNKLDDAAKKYTDIIKQYPNSDVLPRVSLSLGNMHFNAERYEDAIRHYQRITANPEKAGDILPFAMNNLIQAYQSTKLYDDAIRVTRNFIERFPNDESILDKKIKLGTLFTNAGYYDQAVLHFQSIMSDAGSSNEAEIRYNTGEAYYYKGDYQQAILEFLKVPYLVSKEGKINWTATSLYMAGQSYEKMSKFDEAIGMYQQIIDRPGINATFKAGARKEIDRVKTLIKKGSQ